MIIHVCEIYWPQAMLNDCGGALARKFCLCRVFMLKLGVFGKQSQAKSIIILKGHEEIRPNPTI